jgi:hypothetical protein
MMEMHSPLRDTNSTLTENGPTLMPSQTFKALFTRAVNGKLGPFLFRREATSLNCVASQP